MINNVLWEYINYFIIVYLNNILIFFNIKEEYIEYINKVLKLLKDNKLLVKPKKCKFYI